MGAATAANGSAGVADLESALEKTRAALGVVESAEQAAVHATKASSKLVRALLVASVVGVAVVIARKLMGGSGMVPPTDPFGNSSTER
jgi:hypothetical protein